MIRPFWKQKWGKKERVNGFFTCYFLKTRQILQIVLNNVVSTKELGICYKLNKVLL